MLTLVLMIFFFFWSRKDRYMSASFEWETSLNTGIFGTLSPTVLLDIA